jgi:uncharacterized protein with PIN domain
MRNFVQPPPSSHCALCNGELRLKRIEPADLVFELGAEIFVCAKCGPLFHTASGSPRISCSMKPLAGLH